MRIHLALVVVLCVLCINCGSNQSVQKFAAQNNTTLTAQVANNTSAANSFPNQTNGNLGSNNVSKVNLHSLLYSGSSTKIFAQLLVWFGQSNHMQVGYSSTDPVGSMA